jgi:hypothetical protein
VIVLGGSLLLARLAIEPQLLRFALAAALALLVIGFGLRAPRETLFALMIWLAALGFLRRIISGYAPATGNDPFLLVEPLILVVLLIAAAGRGAFRNRTTLSNAVGILTVLVLLGALNPLQGSLVAGLAGLLFILVPMLGFWIGRGLCDDQTMTKILKLVAGVALVAAGYGLAQTFLGLPSWDFNWVWEAQARGYDALFVFSSGGGPGVIRPFAMFSSASEYVVYLGIGIVTWLALGTKTRGSVVALLATAVVAVALLYGSGRGIVVALIAALILMFGARRRQQLSVSMVLAVGVLLLVPPAVRAFVPNEVSTGGSSTLIAHQVEGFSHPLNSNASTAGSHVHFVAEGLRSALDEPLGLGVSAVNIASSRFGGIQNATESDPSNAAVALGIPGLLAYAAVFLLGFRRAYLFALQRHDRLAFAALGILSVTIFQWLTGGNYAVAIIPWLMLGWLDRRQGAGEPHESTRELR